MLDCKNQSILWERLRLLGNLERLDITLGAFEDNFFAIKDEKKFELAGTPSDYGIIRLLYERNDKRSYRALGFMSTAALSDAGDVLTHGLDVHYLSEGGKFRLDGQFFASNLVSSETGYGGFLDFEYTLVRESSNDLE